MFPSVSPKQSFPVLESEVLAYWKANNTFQKSIDSRPEDNPYRFYDGPPFITGTPHYGSLLSSVVKDVVGRYWTMRGKRVDRVWGWDCHGLPIEEKVQKKLGLSSNKEIEERWVKEFIDGCYEYTQSTSAEWDWYIDKIGRWVDMDNAYRTMDQDYMESVMWVFSELWKKWLIYEGKRVSLYSWKLSTPISNFEVAMDDTYQEVNDPAITVKFELEPNDRFPAGTKVLAWTTTPWTIPANMALAVRNDIEYALVAYHSLGDSIKNRDSLLDVTIKIEKTEYAIIANSQVLTIFQKWQWLVAWEWEDGEKEFQKWKLWYFIVKRFKWSELVGLWYVPPFPEYYYQKHGEKNHKIYHADFITDTDGTGIGHEAPEFGDVDFQLAKREGIYISEAMDEAGRYTSQIHDYEGTHYLDLENPEKWANRINIERMKVNNTLFKLENITHRVPFCPRSGTPLMQKAQSSWFIDIASQKDKLLAANEQINWFPEHLKFGRFAKGIESAPDWCISRTRFWWAPMPVWVGEDGEKVVISSREEIFELNKPYGQLEKREVEWKVKYFFKWGEFDGTEFNLHRPYIDAIKLKSPKTGNELTRIPEVLDVWMDSGSMPYAQMHYPFENKGEMEASFPADFIAEYVGQVRAWFYVMHVLGVLLNPNNEPTPTPSFTNVITTGVINGNDGRKMSKSYGNYPDPRLTIEKYGADPIRFYMLNSPLLSGGDMDFKEEQILETIKWVMLPIWNTYSFFTTYANIDGWEKDETEVWFTRHGETTANASHRMSDCSDDAELNETGMVQAQSAWQELKEQGKNFDVIIHTSRKRAIVTAEIIAREIWFAGQFILDERFAEQDAGEFSWKTLTEVAEMVGLPPDAPHNELRRKYKENKKEWLDAFEQRIMSAYIDILEKYKWKRVLIVAHAGTSRPIIHRYFWANRDDAYFDRRVKNAEPFRLMTTPLVNELDRWILSRLQVLIGQVHDAMDGYDVSRACRAIVSYMDELTNWYVRLSRRRFWWSEMTPDKASAYETLYTVLTETSKLLAPYMPFISEDIFRGLTKKESVHLEYITRPNRHLVDSELNRDMQICEHIVSLGLALRSRKNIRVRQPLASVTITRELSEYYQTIIRDELNVKEVRYENPEKLAKKICKPDARKIGPKYGKDVQKVIMEAKNGNFTEKENGIVDVGGFVLESGEYTMEYIPLEWAWDVEGGYGMVISLDTTITESLRLEWYARDIIRAIQDMRKEADYQVTDRISLHIYGAMHTEILAEFASMIQSETLSTLAPLMVNPDVEKDIEIEEGMILTVQIEK
jgi:isoleucyl-tRNA synthetase